VWLAPPILTVQESLEHESLIGIIFLNPVLEIAEGGIASGFYEVFYPYFDRMTSNTWSTP
jgi:hypothetical protein